MADIDRPDYVNSAQWAAVTESGTRLLIVAGPGTGKTHTLTHRLLYRLRRAGPQNKFCAITFTQKAAEEIKTRIARSNEAEPILPRLITGTFHAVCLNILKDAGPLSGLPEGFQCADPAQALEAGRALWPGDTDKQLRERLEAISRWKATVFSEPVPDDVVFYNDFLRGRGLLDFDDLLCETVYFLRAHPAVLSGLQAEIPEIFVDEYQDINPVQHALLKLWVGERGGITAIGDPNQAIYGFRGSDKRFFQSFPDDFPGARRVTLCDNYRSGQTILAASGQVMARDSDGAVPVLTAQLYREGKVTVFEAATDKAEAEYVVHQIEKLVGGMSMFSQDSGRVDTETGGERSFGDIAVLYRLKTQARLLKQAFDRLGIPYHVVGEKKDEEDGAESVCPCRYEEFSVTAERVSLMTLHAAKGLEFPVVFIVGCEDNLLPLNLVGLQAETREERRLFYVGMTRARERLYLLRARKRLLFGQTLHPQASPFLKDFEAGLAEYEQAVLKTKKRSLQDDQMSLF
ncbi:MAG TPA: ATP-dependent helicase [Candidatus Omnitrophota bacterium]|nr:ATP-dependent helicase [Candidatus Omnitrophota bacterium]HQO58300.1 ATP-dependent helicase [Candidatus Omnitrophota bacterium]HQP11336.1 ATP-dependent helicase [Candidatus Omnitrophota bacterium]